MQVRDNHDRYGTVTRIIHWGVASLMLWQFSGMISKLSLGREHSLTQFLAGKHSAVGTVLFVLILFRLFWAFKNRHNRPAHGGGVLGFAAWMGHLALYTLMLLVPLTALIRAWGNDRQFAPFGFEIFPARTPEQVIAPATEIGAMFHGELGWIMGALVVGHITMALLHHVALRDGTLKRMAA